MASDGRPPFGAGAWARFGASVMFQCPLVARTPRGHGGQAAPRGDTATQGRPHAAHTTPAPGGNPFHPTSPSRAFGRAARLSALRQPCVGIVDPLGLEGVSQRPTRVPVPWVAPPVGTGPPRLRGTSLAVVCPGRKRGPSARPAGDACRRPRFWTGFVLSGLSPCDESRSCHVPGHQRMLQPEWYLPAWGFCNSQGLRTVGWPLQYLITRFRVPLRSIGTCHLKHLSCLFCSSNIFFFTSFFHLPLPFLPHQVVPLTNCSAWSWCEGLQAEELAGYGQLPREHPTRITVYNFLSEIKFLVPS